MLQQKKGWTSETEMSDGQIICRVTTPSDAGPRRIRALGYIGLQATGRNHEAHRLAIA